MDHHETIADTLLEIIEYFEYCAFNTAPISRKRKMYRRFIDALRQARTDELEAVFTEDYGK